MAGTGPPGRFAPGDPLVSRFSVPSAGAEAASRAVRAPAVPESGVEPEAPAAQAGKIPAGRPAVAPAGASRAAVPAGESRAAVVTSSSSWRPCRSSCGQNEHAYTSPRRWRRGREVMPLGASAAASRWTGPESRVPADQSAWTDRRPQKGKVRMKRPYGARDGDTTHLSADVGMSRCGGAASGLP